MNHSIVETIKSLWGKSLQSLEKELNFGNGTIARWDKNSPSADKLILVASKLNVTVDYILYGNDPTIASNIYPTDGIISFEEVGSISAGYNGTIDEVRTGNKVDIPLSALGNKNPDDYFVLYVKGNSMYPKLIEGDRILCLRCNSVDSGDLAVILYNGDEATVKKVHYVYGEDWLELIPINPEYQTKRIEKHDLENCRVLGKVVKLIRDF